MFFFPYIIKIVALISPYFIVTVFLLLIITTTTSLCPKLPQFELGILQSVIQELKLNDLDGFDIDNVDMCNFEDFEIYQIVFDDTFLIMVYNQSDEDVKILEVDVEEVHVDEEKPISIVKTYPMDIGSTFNDDSFMDKSCFDQDNVVVKVSDKYVIKVEEEQGLEKLFEELDKFEDCTMESEKTSGDLEEEKLSMVKKVEGEYMVKNLIENDKMSQNSGRSSSWRSNSSSVLSSHGSMREEKEWRKTLACKLFEERHNSLGGEEGMDSLWESYENCNSNKRNETMITNNKSKEMVKKNSNIGGRKLNLGMKKPNLMKISKALKGFGWLHRVKNKHVHRDLMLMHNFL
uniref:uncharacterized protein LOC122583080 n=1 Tax=Erigeron canadensis TaxID=72917 RepID=UPI001CB894F2|nr:uncharacterized protein LOC122583080 [Erigeron canadensis]